MKKAFGSCFRAGFVLVAATTAFLGNAAAQSSYAYSRTVAIDHTKVPNTDQASFPVLFKTTDPLLKTVANGGHVTNAYGYDIIFTADAAGTQKLNHEIEAYNSSTGLFTAWVQAPTVSHSADTVIYLFYGNSSISTSQENRTGVWDSHYEVIQHFPSATTLTANDSTSNGINGTPQNSPAATSGQMGGAAAFVGSTNQDIDLGNNSSLWNGLSSMTWSAWIYPTVNPGSNSTKVLNRGIDSGWNIAVGSSDHPGDVECDMRVSSGTGRFVTANNYVDGILNTWNYVTCAYDGSTFTMYINGAPVNSASATGGPYGGGVGTYDTDVFIGNDGLGHYFTGSIDEVRVSNSARSADWIAAEYNNQVSPGSFYTLGSEQFSGQSQVSTPTFSPPAGTYTSTQTVTISTATSGASIRYTTDGSTPSELTGILYSGPVVVSATIAVKAIAYASGMSNSTIATAAYTINSGGSGYAYSRTVTLGHAQVPNTDQTNFPVLFKTTDPLLKAVANGGHVTNANGYDIIFTADAAGTQKLNHEIEAYNPSTGLFTAWVQAPTVSHAADTVIYLFYGNSSVSTSQQNGTGVWDSHYEVIQHFPSATTLTANDSTSNGINGTPQNSPAATSGQMGGAAAFVGSSSQDIDLGNNSSLWNGLSSMTWSAWIYPTVNPGSNWAKVLNRGIDSGWNIDVGSSDHPGDVECDMRVSAGTGRFVTANNYVDGILNTWNYVTCAYDGSTFTMYINGAPVNSASATGGPYGGGVGAYDTDVFIGNDGLGHYFTGSIDEIRVSNSARSADWIAAEYNNQVSPGSFYALGSEQFSGQPQVSTPTFDPPAGTYTSTQTVTISTATYGASIRYTTDGSTPSETAGTLYTGYTGVTVSSTTTLKAIAYKSGYTDSSVASATYTIPPVAATPTFSPGAGSYGATQTVTISTMTSGASIRYTTDGSTPTETAGALYTGGITVNSTTTLKAIAYESGYTDSPVASATYTIPPPSITSLSPTSGAAGVQVTISGSGFGSTQGTGKVWLGTTLGTVVSWSDTAIAATVAPNASSGIAQVQQYGVWSNSVTFNVNTATITNVTPASGLPGTQVTIAGSGFGSAQGSGQVWLGTANAVVQSWSDTQVVALVGAGAASGNAQVLQGGVMSNAVSFNVNLPHTTSISPTYGGAGTSVTITGTGFGSLQGSGTVWLGSQSATAVSWSDTQVVAVVAYGALTGIARVQQNSVWSNAVSFTVPSGSNVTLLPNLINMAVGDTQVIQALGPNGQPVTGLTWASSDPTVVSLSTDDPPILSALGPGHVTVTGGTASADVTVNAAPLPSGAVLWSNPGDGSGAAQIMPAVPSSIGLVDVFALQNDGTVQAITSEGVPEWSLAVPSGAPLFGSGAWTYASVMPDFQGGLVVTDLLANGGDGSIMKVDGITGQPYPAYALGRLTDNFIAAAVHTDGTIFVLQTDSVLGIDPTTGTQKFSVPLPIGQPIVTSFANCPSGNDVGYGYGEQPGHLIIAGDGNAYVFYSYDEFVNECGIRATHLRLLQVSSSGASNLLTIIDRQAPTDLASYQASNLQASIITNADTGVLLTWGQFFSAGEGIGPTQYGMAITTGTSVSIVNAPSVPSQPVLGSASPVFPVLQAADGSFFGSYQTNMVAFDQAGNVRWMVPNEYPLLATADGGVIGQSGVSYDQNGNATGQSSLSATVSPGWFGNILGTGYSVQSGEVTLIAASSVSYAPTFAAFIGGNASGNGTAIMQVMSNHAQTGLKQLPLPLPRICSPVPLPLQYPPTCGNINAIELLTSQSVDSIFQTLIQTFAPVTIATGQTSSPNPIMTFTGPGNNNAINVTMAGQIINIAIAWWAGGVVQPPFQIMTERVDSANHVISAVTLAGHPLAGWRYWRVYSIGTNDVVIETGAYDQPGPGPVNYAGYFISPPIVQLSWQKYMQFLKTRLNAPQGTNLANSLGGITLRSPHWTLVHGYWDYFGDFTNYILNNVCQSTLCN